MTNGGGTSTIGRLVDRYSLLGMGADLEAQWRNSTADPEETLEGLTTYFNTAIVRAIFARVGSEPADYSAAEVCSHLATEDAPAADEAAVRAWLDDHGVDPGALSDDFVTERTMHRYLRDERGLEVPIPLRYPPEVAKREDVTADDLDAHIEETANPRHEKRLRFIRQLYDGKTVPEAAEAVDCNPSSGYRWLGAWEDGGVEGLLTDGELGWNKLSPREERQFVRRLARTDTWQTDAIHELLTTEFDVDFSDRHLRRKLTGYGLKAGPNAVAYHWPAEAPAEPPARLSAALAERELSADGRSDGR